MKEHPCAICLTTAPYKVLYPENLNFTALSERTFSARRNPDRVHYRIVQCQRCGLIYSNPVLDEKALDQFYRNSHLTYEELLGDLTETYGHYMERATRIVPERGNFLEIGCGDGFLLEKALTLGYQHVHGVEPSAEAVAKARPDLRQRIHNGFLREGLFPENFFDLIAFFQTLDHLLYPNEFLQTVWRILKQKGVVLALNHDVRAWSARILGERSPIIDIEHIYLYDKHTMRRLFEQNSYTVLEVGSAFNIYPLNYWVKMTPLPRVVRALLLSLISATGLERQKVRLKAGNLYLICMKFSL